MSQANVSSIVSQCCLPTEIFRLIRLIAEAGLDGGIYGVLNNHATMLAAGKVLSDDLKSAFMHFIDTLEKTWPDVPQASPQSPITQAYWKYWNERQAAV